MVTLLLSLFGVSVVSSVVFLLRQVKNAPEGYEDETGFHYVTLQADRISRRYSSGSDADLQSLARSSKAAFKSISISSPSH